MTQFIRTLVRAVRRGFKKGFRDGMQNFENAQADSEQADRTIADQLPSGGNSIKRQYNC